MSFRLENSKDILRSTKKTPQLFFVLLLLNYLTIFHILPYESHQLIYELQKILVLLWSLHHKIFSALGFSFRQFLVSVFHKCIETLILPRTIYVLDRKILNHIFGKPIKFYIFNIFFISS